MIPLDSSFLGIHLIINSSKIIKSLNKAIKIDPNIIVPK